MGDWCGNRCNIQGEIIAMPRVPDDIVYGRTALRQGLPWIVPKSLEYIQQFISPKWKVFEWGAGGSTVYWASNCAFVVSIEHNSDWYDRVNKMLLDREVRNKAHLMLVRGLAPNIEEASYRFKPYANVILAYPNRYFDLIMVDGEASSRGWCLTNAEKKIKKGGYIILDNSDWLQRELEGFEREDFVAKDLKWIGQPGKFNWYTSVFRRY